METGTMRTTTIRIALTAGMALAIAACGSGGTEANNAATNELDANMTLSEPANDASAMESTTNAAETTAPADTNATGTGADTGTGSSGNNVEANTVGM
jgi:hypothetical protein